MDPATFIDPNLTPQDLLVLKDLLRDDQTREVGFLGISPFSARLAAQADRLDDTDAIIHRLQSVNNPQDAEFEPTVFVTWDTPVVHANLPPLVDRWLFRPYIRWARRLVRVETDVVMLTHLLLYLTTSVPSALWLYGRFSWVHGVLHALMQGWYVGTYTLMMHQHIHMGGILCRQLAWLDALFPYITNPLMGHTWNSYYYHHVKHHHVEGNGPDDLSSTIRYQRDELRDFLCYVARFVFLVWFELPLYFFRKGHYLQGCKAGAWELASYASIYALFRWGNARATVFVFIVPLVLLRMGLMIGNWGQHAFVDEIDPNSDFRSSITLIDVPVGSPKEKKTFIQIPLTISTPAGTGATIPWPFSSRKTGMPPSTRSSSATSTT
ncbi:hypothetical protein ASPZODRAFT_132560 [Penicilliopsis zonata CBS 506.65]|uniref:Fatty acid desaturase domain-containing protein n=1 Tax=Penicilliopsis zonata CBS 506.65 TaxID=1073090 RepID=A0A1L9SH93_9EURO|nr:hypothetical protein ASPZODRAFT_132560 [Penicilliopsis zonata CBS 506.65]OJJ46487.1 hypothetical protein ASPZODRAFT_132560 [Penicilliopsis zonata CBS 506.65]